MSAKTDSYFIEPKTAKRLAAALRKTGRTQLAVVSDEAFVGCYVEEAGADFCSQLKEKKP